MNLSLCCISNILAEQGIKFRTMTYKSFSSKPREESLLKLSGIIQNNFKTTRDIIHHCKNSGIKGYRLSSDLTPVLNHPDVNLSLEELPEYKLIQYQINELKKAIKETGIKVSAHPSEYITLTSEDPKAIQNSITDLETHADIFDRLDLPQSYEAPLNIHVRKDGDPIDISNRFILNYNKLSNGVRKRLVLENNDNANGVWSIKNLHTHFYQTNGIPITFDTLHHKILPDNLSEEEAFNLAYETWNTTPIFHYSEGKNNTRAHEHMAQFLPPTYKEVYWDVELKNKDYAILEMLEKCKTLLC
jgi:UV DNA damage endonuclease